MAAVGATHPGDVWDYSVFLDVEFTVSVARCAARDTSWASAERRATRVISNNVLAAPAIRSPK